MLSKTAMALIPAGSLVGAAALAPTTSLPSTMLGSKPLGTAKCGEDPPARSRAKEHS
jgi:hypothetical protein